MSSRSHDSRSPRRGSIVVRVFDESTDAAGDEVRWPVQGATIGLYRYEARSGWKPTRDSREGELQRTDANGETEFDSLMPGEYAVFYHNLPKVEFQRRTVEAGRTEEVSISLAREARLIVHFFGEEGNPSPRDVPRPGDHAELEVAFNESNDLFEKGAEVRPQPGVRSDRAQKHFHTKVPQSGALLVKMAIALPLDPDNSDLVDDAGSDDAALLKLEDRYDTAPGATDAPHQVALNRSATAFTADVAFWRQITNSTEAMSFNNYLLFMDSLFCGRDLEEAPGFTRQPFAAAKKNEFRSILRRRRLPFTDTDAYRVVKAATEAFVMVNCGTVSADAFGAQDAEYLGLRDIPMPSGNLKDAFTSGYLKPLAEGHRILPYLAVIRKKLPDVDIKTTLFEDAEFDNRSLEKCYGILQERLVSPCLIELIWSYWHEEGMLVQTMNALSRRFQNVRAPGAHDPLANLEIDPLRPLNNLMWGYIQDEQHRLTVQRRNCEYDHHYGLRLEGRAVQGLRPADSRSKFLEAFHNLFRLCIAFYKQDDDTTVKADAFPVLNALKEVHLILTEGQHNQFGDLPSTARIEMLMQQWLLARPEFREFLPTRISVAYPEPWMDRVDAMKKLQGWSDASVLHFRNLAVFGEQILISIRWGHWSDVQEPGQALNWVRHFRPQIQGYIHAYRATTGAELAVDAVDSKVDTTLPSVLLSRRLATQKRSA